MFSPRHIFEKLFNQEGVEGYEDIVKQCVEESKKDEDKCALTLCELFLTFADNKNAPIPSWAWKSKPLSKLISCINIGPYNFNFVSTELKHICFQFSTYFFKCGTHPED